ncbi:hypothetical protein, partial [Aeromonas veronii]|uniref:hypothetical protein n=2 Tax=Aeromonas TaxID=642 RepID=UPI00195E5113
SSGVFYCLQFRTSPDIKLSPSCHSLITLLKPQKDLFFCSIFAHQFNVLDTKSTECDASTFLVMPALV